jgi:hypothetical protein
VVPYLLLHWHIVPRYWNHPRWGAPIRLTALSEMADKRQAEPDQQALISELQSVLAVGHLYAEVLECFFTGPQWKRD